MSERWTKADLGRLQDCITDHWLKTDRPKATMPAEDVEKVVAIGVDWQIARWQKTAQTHKKSAAHHSFVTGYDDLVSLHNRLEKEGLRKARIWSRLKERLGERGLPAEVATFHPGNAA